MHSISETARDLLNVSVCLLNQPTVKEGIKNIASAVTFVFGMLEAHEIYQIVRGQPIFACAPETPKWIQCVNKVSIICAKLSFILSAGVSRPGIYLIGGLIGCVFSTQQLTKVFGPNTIFAVNPWHPRHVVSIAAVILALPSVVQTTCQGFTWAYRKIRQYPPDQSPHYYEARNCITDTKIRLLTLWNIISSRPILHLGNRMGHLILRRAEKS